MSEPWFSVLLDPVRPQVQAAWARLPVDAAAAPRAGLAGAIVIHVARGFGTRRWQEAGRVAVAAVEAANHHLTRGDDRRTAWLDLDLGPVERALRQAARRDEPLLRRVTARLLATAEDPMSESVGLLRGAVTAGVLAGNVPDEVHAALDVWATELGRAMEGEPWDSLEARAALAELPSCDAGERLTAVLDAPIVVLRGSTPWAPRRVPAPSLPTDPLEASLIAPFLGSGTLPATARWLSARGGKRLRARIALAAARAVGGEPQAAAPRATAVEWAHTASLVLDDIIDEAELRRGSPPLHRVTDPPFATGAAAWVLGRVLLDTPDPGRFADALVTLAKGQRDELRRAGDATLSLDEWYTIAAAKTAKLFAYAAAGGGAAAGGTRRQQRALGRFGHELGLAFQIIDDLLDVIGDAAELGKNPGQDLRSGRMTYPVILLRDGGGELADIAAAVEDRGIVPLCRSRAFGHLERALEHLSGLPGDTRELLALATACVDRST